MEIYIDKFNEDNELQVLKNKKKCCCGNDLPQGRWTYCSDSCYEVAAKQKQQNHWTKIARNYKLAQGYKTDSWSQSIK